MDASRITGATNLPQTPPPITRQEASATAETTNTQVPSDAVDIGKSGKNEEGVPKKWLIMNYISADTNLVKYQLKNIDQMEKVGSDKNTHIVAMVDVGHDKAPIPMGREKVDFSRQPGAWKGARTLYVVKDDEKNRINSPVIADHGIEFNMANSQVLKQFVVDMMNKYPADHYALFMNSHGAGFFGAMTDDSDGKIMRLPFMRDALLDAQKETGKKLDIIGFDCCLMAQTEAAHTLKDTANVLLASEESEMGPGWAYTSMLGAETVGEVLKKVEQNHLYRIDMTPHQFAKTVVEVNEKNNELIPTFSATDLTKMDNLKDKMAGLAKAIINTRYKKALRDAVARTERYGDAKPPFGDYRDLGHFCARLIDKSPDKKVREAAEKVREALHEAVFANETHPDAYPKSEGLSVYVPKGRQAEKRYKELDFVKETKWDKAMESLGFKPKKKIKKESDRSPMLPDPSLLKDD